MNKDGLKNKKIEFENVRLFLVQHDVYLERIVIVYFFCKLNEKIFSNCDFSSFAIFLLQIGKGKRMTKRFTSYSSFLTTAIWDWMVNSTLNPPEVKRKHSQKNTAD